MIRLPLLAIAISLIGAVPAAAQDSPRTFVETIYAGYTRNGPGTRDRLQLFTPDLVRLAEASDDPPDYDVICQCNDWDIIAGRWLSLDQKSNTAIARLRLRYSPDATIQQPQTVTLHLRRGARGWLIADIGSANARSLRATLAASVKPKGRKKP